MPLPRCHAATLPIAAAPAGMKLLLMAAAAAAAAAAPSADLPPPRECRPRADAPYLPIFHIVGNITETGGGSFTTEAINDVSKIMEYKGVWHVFHQCCQNHWDHVVSDDLLHWRRLPPPVRPTADPAEWYDARGSYDGSISLLAPEHGGPVMLYDAMPNPPPDTWHGPRGISSSSSRLGLGDDTGWMAVARPKNASDPYLREWVKDPGNPIWFDLGEVQKKTLRVVV